jgi:hypothetical protein
MTSSYGWRIGATGVSQKPKLMNRCFPLWNRSIGNAGLKQSETNTRKDLLSVYLSDRDDRTRQ